MQSARHCSQCSAQDCWPGRGEQLCPCWCPLPAQGACCGTCSDVHYPGLLWLKEQEQQQQTCSSTPSLSSPCLFDSLVVVCLNFSFFVCVFFLLLWKRFVSLKDLGDPWSCCDFHPSGKLQYQPGILVELLQGGQEAGGERQKLRFILANCCWTIPDLFSLLSYGEGLALISHLQSWTLAFWLCNK